MRLSSILPVLALALALAGCTGSDRKHNWPTLAPRAGEMSPLVPRTPLGACAGCGQDVFTQAAEAVPAPLPPPPADAAARIDAIDKAIADVEAKYPAQHRSTDAAIDAARGQAADSDANTEAEVQRSRLESLFLPLAVQSRALDQLEDDLAGKAGADALLARVAALRERLARLDAARGDVPGL
jgi:hypothetical protein